MDGDGTRTCRSKGQKRSGLEEEVEFKTFQLEPLTPWLNLKETLCYNLGRMRVSLSMLYVTLC